MSPDDQRRDRRARVLIIDDEPEIRELLAYEFSLQGYDVATAEHGGAAVDAARVQRFDLAITDVKMPVMDGYETIKALRALDPTLRVLIATGYPSEETRAACASGEAIGYVRKPFSLDDLFAIVDVALSRPGRG